MLALDNPALALHEVNECASSGGIRPILVVPETT